MHDAELLRSRIREAGWRNHRAVVIVRWLVGECAPHPLELATIRIEDSDAVIAVTISYEQFVSLWIDPLIRRPVQILCVGIALALIAAANLHDKFAILREF